MSNETILDLEAMMDGTLDAVVAAPEFINPPAGDYVLGIKDAKLEKYKSKTDQKEGVRIRVSYTVNQTVELPANSEELPVPDGTMFSESFMYSEEGLPYFKQRAQNILNVKSVEGVSLRELFDALKGTEFPARISIRKSTVNGKDFENVNIRTMHQTPAE